MCLLFAFYSSPCWILLKRRTGSGERKQARGTGNGERGSKNRIENEATNRARVQVGFCSHFSLRPVIAYVLTSFWKNLTMVLLRAHPVNPCGWSGLCRNLISRGMVPTPKSIVCFKVRLVQSHTCRREPYSPKKIHNRLCMLVAPTSTGVQAGAYSEPKWTDTFSFKMLQAGSRNRTPWLNIYP